MNDKLLVIARNLPPLTGGMERLIYNAVIRLSSDRDIYVIGPAGSRSHLPSHIKVFETPGTGLASFAFMAVPLALWIALRTRPTALLAGSGVVAPIAWIVRLIFGIPYVVLVHGLDIIARHRVYQSLFLPCIRAADVVVANSSNTQSLAHHAGIQPNKTVIVTPGVKFPPAEPTQTFRTCSGIQSGPLLLSVGRIVPRKGLARFIQKSMPAIVARYPDVQLAIIGEEPGEALLKHGSEFAAIQQAIHSRGLESSVICCGRLSDDLVAAAYKEADLFVFPVLDLPGDVEGFGMVAVEAAAYGLPSIGFRAGGLPDAILDGKTGLLADPECYDQLGMMVCETLAKGKNAMHDACLAHAQNHSWQRYGEALIRALNDVPSMPDTTGRTPT